MKIRSDFVTNSSSSSFILSFEDNNDIECFKSNCQSYDYEDFFNLINNLAGDFLNFSNETRQEMAIRPLIDKIKDKDFGLHASIELNKLYDEDYKLKPWETISIQINSFGNNEVDLEKLDFTEIDEENFTIEIINNKERCNKTNIIEQLKWYYAGRYISELLDKKINRDNFENYEDYTKAKDDYKKTTEYEELVDDYLKDTDFFDKKEKIEKAKFVVSGMIWDTSGGLLEWAIRNGFIEDNFYNNCVICYNIG